MNSKKYNDCLCHCLQMDSRGKSSDIVQSLSPSDWQQVIQRADRFSVTPLLYRALKPAFAQHVVPVAVENRLHASYLACLSRNTLLLHEFAKILVLLKQNNIPVIVLKGAALAEDVYENVGLRPMSDIDILVRVEHLHKTALLFSRQGNLLKDPSKVVLDLHWNIDRSFVELPMDVADIWKRSRTIYIEKTPALALSIEDQLLNVVSHVTFHHFLDDKTLRTLCDIREIIHHRGREMDWEQVVFRADQWKMRKALFLCLFLSRELLHARVPEDILQRLERGGIPLRIKEWTMDRVFRREPIPFSLSPHFWRLWRPGDPLMGRLRTLVRLLFPPKEFLVKVAPHGDHTEYGLFSYFLRLRRAWCRYEPFFRRLLFADSHLFSIISAENQTYDKIEELKGT